MCQNLLDIPHICASHLKFFIIRYQEIIIFAEKVEKLFTYIALSQLVSNTLITCCVGFLIVIVSNISIYIYIYNDIYDFFILKMYKMNITGNTRG